MPSFTVGPYEARSNDYFGTRIETPHDVWKFQDDYAPSLDDLRLLAGSWEMYDALRVLVDHAQEAYPHFESDRGQRDIASALAVLAKVEGPA